MSVTIGGQDSFNPIATVEVNNSFVFDVTIQWGDSFYWLGILFFLDSLFVIATALMMVNSGSLLLSWAMIH